ncbi:MAG: apolipoprotein N-acyltransferase [bacterium]|nr:apolipoprotein N-acyltransferase [bacterium]
MKKTISNLIPNLDRIDCACALLSAALFAAAFPPFDCSFLIWIALLPALTRVRKNESRRAIWLGLLTGFAYNLLLLHWLFLVAGPALLLLALVLGASYIPSFWIWSRFRDRRFGVLLFGFSWAAVEYLRSLGWFAFSWGFAGHAVFNMKALRQAIEWFGITGLSFFIVSLNAALSETVPWVWSLIRRSPDRQALPAPRLPLAYAVSLVVLLLAIDAAGYVRRGQLSPANDSSINRFRVALIQGAFAQDEKDSASIQQMLDRYLELSRQAMSESPDLIVWPESTIPYPLNYWDEGLSKIIEFSSEHDVELLTGSVHAVEIDEGHYQYYNRALHFRPDLIGGEPPTLALKQSPSYDKMHLVPYGEWIPWGSYWPFYYIETLIEEAGAGIFQPGSHQTLFQTRKGPRFAVSICFESTLSWQARLAQKNGADFLVVITNDAWFKRSAGLRQHFIQCQFRAVESRLPVLRDANTGVTGLINRMGDVVDAIPDNEPGYYLAELNLSENSFIK